MTTESLPRRDGARPVLRLAFTLAWSVGALLATAVVVTAASAASVATDPSRCATIDGDAARLACFDAAFPRGGPQSPPAANSNPPAAAAAPPPEAVFGVNDTVRRARGERPAAEAAPPSIESTLARLDTLESGRFRVTLANGQVWEQVEPSLRFQPRTGETITVRQAALGSYLMRATRGAAVRARRLR